MTAIPNRYHLCTLWRTPSPLERVWPLILHSENWPRWWRGVEQARTVRANEGDDGVGSIVHYVWRSTLGYRLRFDVEATQVVPHVLLEGAARGDVRGIGRWRFRRVADATEIHHAWDVEVERPGLRLIAPVARPLFEWNHRRLMRLGARGLARELGQPVACEHERSALT